MMEKKNHDTLLGFHFEDKVLLEDRTNVAGGLCQKNIHIIMKLHTVREA